MKNQKERSMRTNKSNNSLNMVRQIVLRISEVESRIGYSSATLYRRVADRLWTKPVKFSANVVGWPEFEVNALLAASIAGKSKEEIKKLVTELEKSRENQMFYYYNQLNYDDDSK